MKDIKDIIVIIKPTVSEKPCPIVDDIVSWWTEGKSRAVLVTTDYLGNTLDVFGNSIPDVTTALEIRSNVTQ